MISNYEFIKTQAFELSWAVFRCTALFSQDKLRREVEAAAVELAADSGILAEMSDGESLRIEKLTALVRLAESVGQIAPVNARVLYRELDNLAKAIRLESITRREQQNIAASLDQLFTNSAYAKTLPDLGQMESGKSGSSSDAASRPVVADQTASASLERVPSEPVRQGFDGQFGSIESLLSAATRSVQATPTSSDGGVRDKQSTADRKDQSSEVSANANPFAPFIQPAITEPVQINSPVRQVSSTVPSSEARPVQSGSSANVSEAPVAPPVRQTQVATVVRPTVPAQGSWQNVILQKVKDLGQTTTKELTASFPEISERTIRFYLQKLVDSGSIDRIGSTGPGAAYRAK